MSWFGLADKAINAAVKVEEIKSQKNASSGYQQGVIEQTQAQQQVEAQQQVQTANKNKIMLFGVGAAALLVVMLVVMRK